MPARPTYFNDSSVHASAALFLSGRLRRLSLPDAKVNQALRFVNLNYDNFDFITDSEDGFRAPIRANAKQSFDACLDLDVGSIHLDL